MARRIDLVARGRARSAIDQTAARLRELDSRLAEIAQREPYREPVGWLRCFRGIDTLAAMLLLG
jgi:hypothetical protein